MKTERTADGSYTLYVPELDEHYHSVKGALTESEHVFLRMGLEACTEPCPHILEIGLGTGLNCFLTYLASQEQGRPVHYTGIELYPPDEALLRLLDYPSRIGKGHADVFGAIHRAEWEADVALSPSFTLHKVHDDFTRCSLPGKYHLVYFDAFAPDKQPDLWTPDLFGRLYGSLHPGGILTTYCAKGAVRRMLQAVGFRTERLPGPPGGKREILRATKPLEENE